MNLETTYLGLSLSHPFTVGASPLGSNLDRVRAAEDAGASAIVLHSLFEEQLLHHERGLDAHVHSYDESFGEATSYFPTAVDYHYGPEQYLTHLKAANEAVGIPVIASLNGTHLESWTHYAAEMEQAGAAALEMNLYYQPRSNIEDAATIEMRLLEAVHQVVAAIKIPVAVKLSPFFSSLPHFISRLEEAGAQAAVLFNRFYQPDIDIEELETQPRLQLSTSSELLLRLRWMAVLYGRTSLDLACTGGIHTREDAIKAVMSGADCLQMVSGLLQNGVERIGQIRTEVEQWMEEHEYESLEQMKGSMSYLHCPDPEAIERANYLRILQSWQPTAETA